MVGAIIMCMIFLSAAPPNITNPAQNRTELALAGTGPVMFVCDSRGNPLPDLTWYFNGGPVSTDSVSVNDNQLVISTPQIHHSGVYECVAANTFNGQLMEDRRQFLLEVRVPPNITIPVQNQTELALVGIGPVTFMCESEGNPLPDLTWYFNGGPVSTDSVSVNDNQLVISKPQIHHSGVYECVATNTFNGQLMEDRRQFLLEVRAPPNITIPVQNQTELALVGIGPVTFVCESEGDPLPDLTWYFNGGLVFPDSVSVNNNQLVISSPQDHHSGVYECVATNTINGQLFEDRRQFLFEVRAPPNITIPVQNQTESVLVGIGPVTFVCESEGDPLPDLTWYFNGGLVPPDLVSVNNNQLVISSTQDHHSGVYECVATNTINGQLFEDRRQFLLEVRAPPNITIPVQNQTESVLVGIGPVTFVCESEGDPLPDLTWNFNGGLVLPVSVSVNNNQLVISSPQDHHSGVYECVATNTINGQLMEDRRQFLLEVRVPPNITIPVQNQTELALIGTGPVTFVCESEGDPLPDLTWYFNGGLVFPDSVSVNNNQLVISSPQDHHSGVYECVATNTINGQLMEDRRQFLLEVRAPPNITIPVQNQTELALIGTGPVTFVCESEGDPLPDLTWYFNGGPVSSENVSVSDNQLVISSPQVNHSGVYECVATNTINGQLFEDRKQFLLEVRMPSKSFINNVILRSPV